MPDRYFELATDVGLDPDENPEPLVGVGLSIQTPAMLNGEVVGLTSATFVKAIPGTRILKVEDPRVADAMAAQAGPGGHMFQEVDPPSKTDLKKQRDETTDAREKAGTHVTPEEAAAATTVKEA